MTVDAFGTYNYVFTRDHSLTLTNGDRKAKLSYIINSTIKRMIDSSLDSFFFHYITDEKN